MSGKLTYDDLKADALELVTRVNNGYAGLEDVVAFHSRSAMAPIIWADIASRKLTMPLEYRRPKDAERDRRLARRDAGG
jgi:hypothetical protein